MADEKNEIVIINVQAKFKRMDSKIQVQSIGDSVAQVLYGKRMVNANPKNNGILGKAQNVLVNKCKGKTYQVMLPADSKQDHYELYKYICNMVKHGKSHGVDISIM